MLPSGLGRAIDLLDILADIDIITPEYPNRVDMSIVVGLIGYDGIVLATDSQRTEINYSLRANKLWALTPTMGIMTFGILGQWMEFLVHLWREGLASKEGIGYYDVIDLFALEVSLKIRKTFDKSQMENLKKTGLDFIIAGYDNNGEASLVSIGSTGQWNPLTQSPYCIGGIHNIGLYWIKKVGLEDRLFNRQLPCEFLKKLATMIILETTVFSDMVCEPIQMAVVDKKRGFQDVPIEEINRIKTELDSKQQWLYDYLGKQA